MTEASNAQSASAQEAHASPESKARADREASAKAVFAEILDTSAWSEALTRLVSSHLTSSTIMPPAEAKALRAACIKQFPMQSINLAACVEASKAHRDEVRLSQTPCHCVRCGLLPDALLAAINDSEPESIQDEIHTLVSFATKITGTTVKDMAYTRAFYHNFRLADEAVQIVADVIVSNRLSDHMDRAENCMNQVISHQKSVKDSGLVCECNCCCEVTSKWLAQFDN